jgi:hypothetical protein
MIHLYGVESKTQTPSEYVSSMRMHRLRRKLDTLEMLQTTLVICTERGTIVLFTENKE